MIQESCAYHVKQKFYRRFSRDEVNVNVGACTLACTLRHGYETIDTTVYYMDVKQDVTMLFSPDVTNHD